MQAMQGTSRLNEFLAAYQQLLGETAHRRIVLVSPFQFESESAPLPDLSAQNKDLLAYVAAIETLAKKYGWTFINLKGEQSKTTQPLTTDGSHLNSLGHWH